MADVWANSMACHPRTTCHIVGCCHLANLMLWSQSYVSHCRVLPPANSTACHPRATYHTRVLPLGEFTLMIPERAESHAQGAVTWRSQCHDRATLQGVIILSAILKPYFIFICFLMQFELWRAAAFVSSPIHLFLFFLRSSVFGICFACVANSILLT